MKVVRRVSNSFLPPAGRLHGSKSVLKDLLFENYFFLKSSSQTFNVDGRGNKTVKNVISQLELCFQANVTLIFNNIFN